MPTLNVATATELKAAVPTQYSGLKAKIRSKKLKQKMVRKTKGSTRASYTG